MNKETVAIERPKILRTSEGQAFIFFTPEERKQLEAKRKYEREYSKTN